MAQTGRITRRMLRTLAAIDALGGPLFALLRGRRTPAPPGPPRRILVVELWGIGDVVLATPALAELRERFPDAKVALLARPHARELLDGSGLVDEVIAVDFPWMAHTAKYAPARYLRARLPRVFRELRSRRFDVSLDARRDLRSNLVTFLSGACRRIGYDFGGGAALLTDAVSSGAQDGHRIDDWLEIPVPAVFGLQRREWFGPRYPIHQVVSISEMQCRPCFESWILQQITVHGRNQRRSGGQCSRTAPCAARQTAAPTSAAH